MKLLLSILVLFLASGCINQYKSTEDVKYSKYNVNSFSMSKLVCDPFEDSASTVQGGLKASLYTMANGEKPNQLDTFFDSGVKSDKDIFFSQVNVPTRVFSLGFPTEMGEMIKSDDGDDLVEWFALRMQSVLKLGSNDEEGFYELALLADDGARLSIKDDAGNYIVAVDNDGLHPTRMGCGAVVHMTRDTRLSVQIDYFQGPRWHISVFPMWRKVDASTVAEQRCGQMGNSLFFDSENNSAEMPAYNELLSRNWQPISDQNWQLEGVSEGVFNPCTQGDGISISDFDVTVNTEKLVTVSWTTDKPSTSQVLFKNVNTQKEYDSGSDNILRTKHSINIDMSGVTVPFEFQALSVAEDLSKVISDTEILNF